MDAAELLIERVKSIGGLPIDCRCFIVESCLPSMSTGHNLLIASRAERLLAANTTSIAVPANGAGKALLEALARLDPFTGWTIAAATVAGEPCGKPADAKRLWCRCGRAKRLPARDVEAALRAIDGFKSVDGAFAAVFKLPAYSTAVLAVRHGPLARAALASLAEGEGAKDAQ